MNIGNILAGRKDRKDTERNLKRLEEAVLASRKLAAVRISDEEIKNLLARLVYEADSYITAAKESEGAVYDPLVLDGLETAGAAINAWKKSGNEIAATTYMSIDGKGNGILIPKKDDTAGQDSGEARDSELSRERVLKILRRNLQEFVLKNNVRTAGDNDAALTALE